MSPRKPLRTVFFAVSAAVALTTGPALLTAPAVRAAPPAEYPLSEDGEEEEEETERANTPENGLAEHAERAERAGGGIATEIIDLSADMLKCGLSIATETVSCPLGG